jgi:hypothetical protein
MKDERSRSGWKRAWRGLVGLVKRADRRAWKYWRGGTAVVGVLFYWFLAREAWAVLVRGAQGARCAESADHPTGGVDMRPGASKC